ncbi:glycosyltransferase family 4 protein [Dyadobacter psychrophilus]|uniref:Glycosyltransferase involved in cell wall bisynthesis n=1 Tax=Dyadobacter psychrophilus TaxID=651661 RepID=A0A1T5HD18_9BACT|nr:glycosyltransferase family 4 protein [Dyadobacter psychrophilus]SKC18421.1 Glycosyltransferase involved in cell wall bisynthesis [Dyadobacter psychrophilus]
MKLLVIHTLYNVRGGEETIVENETHHLLEAGLDVKTIFFSNGKGFKAMLKFIMLPFNLFSFLSIKNTINEYKPDIIHLHNWSFAASPAVILAAKWANVPIVLTIQNYRLLCPSATLFHNGAIFHESLNTRFPWKAVFKGVYKNSILMTFWLAFTVFLHKRMGTWKYVNKYLVHSEFVRSLFLNSDFGLREDQVLVKANSTASNNEKVAANSGDFFLYVGRLNEEKGISQLISAFANSDHKLVIIGDGPLLKFTEQSAEKSPNIVFKGKLPIDLVKKNMQEATALVFPSIWYEGMPLTIIESFSVSTPVIASKLGAMTDMITDGVNGLHFEAGNVADLQNKIDNWKNFPLEIKRQMRENARETYERKYTPDRNIKSLISIYEELT